MLYKKSMGEKVFDIINVVFMILLIVVTVYPILHVLFGSLSAAEPLSKHRGLLLYPKGISLFSYKKVIENPMISIGYKNTLIYVVLGTSINLLMTSLGAYALSRKRFIFRDPLMFIIVVTMFFTGGLIPQYLLIVKLDWIDTILPLIIPQAISTWNLIVMRTSFKGIPDSMEESAKIDGANDFTILFRIVLPLSLPLLAVMTLFYSVGHWNAWFYAMIYLRSRTMYPLQLVLREILIGSSLSGREMNLSDIDQIRLEYTVKYATVMISIIPVLLIYPLLQKYFVKGVMIGAIKG